MPVPTVDQIKKKESSLKRTLAEQGESMEPAKRRHVRKKLKRAQRKRRDILVQVARRAPKPKLSDAAAAEAKPAADAAESQEAKSE